MGKPSLYTPELVESICERLSKGEPMAVICRDEGMPAYRTVKDWIDSKPEVSAAIAHAREEGFDVIAASTLEIADDARNDYMESAGEDGAAFYRLNGEHIQRSKLRIDTRLKLLAKWDPKRYGDKLITENTNHTTVELVDTDEMDRRLDRAIAAACAAGSAVDAKPG